MSEKTTLLPKKIPVDKKQLERAILLLANRTKAELQTKARQELVELIGAYPSVELLFGKVRSRKRLQQKANLSKSSQKI